MSFEMNDNSLKHPTQKGAGSSSKNLVTFQNFDNIVLSPHKKDLIIQGNQSKVPEDVVFEESRSSNENQSMESVIDEEN